MIPRYQRILFWILVALSVFMVGYLIYMHHVHQQNADLTGDDTPITAPESGSAQNVTYLSASDNDGSIAAIDRSVALPSNSAVRARALLEHLLADYALSNSQHPLPGGIAVEDVFLVPLPLTAQGSLANGTKDAQLPNKAEDADPLTHASGELAVVNLRSAWVETHPSGVGVETLTLMSILGTLHANLPEVTQVRFLVDGQQRDTLAGHIDLTRVYEATDTATAKQ